MNPQLARIGRLDPARSAARFAREFRPGVTRLIHVDGAFAGCVTFYGDDGERVLEHFYLTPAYQRRGLGAEILSRLLAEADAAGAAVRLSVLAESAANRFYPRHGFVETHREAFDIYYRREPARLLSPERDARREGEGRERAGSCVRDPPMGDRGPAAGP